MNTTPARPSRVSLVRALSKSLLISKSSPSRVKGLPLVTRGITLDTYDTDAYRVRWTAGSHSEGTRQHEAVEHLTVAADVLEAAGFVVKRDMGRNPDLIVRLTDEA